jgi:hypothetical protein
VFLATSAWIVMKMMARATLTRMRLNRSMTPFMDRKTAMERVPKDIR